MIDYILKLANHFYSLAGAEELPKNSENLKTVLTNIEGLETYKARKEYAEKNLKHLSSGSSRIVYVTDKETVIKLAKNDKGIAQNKSEYEIESKAKSKYLNKVLTHASNFYWIETKFLNKITEKEFEEMTDVNFNDFGECMRYALKSLSGHTDKKKPESFDDVKKSDIFKELDKIADKFKLMGGDLARISSFGTNGKIPILLDAGLTKEIFEKYYDSSKSSKKSS